MSTTGLRSRWAAIGAAVAVTLGAGGIGLVSATSPAGAVAYVPIEPCRAADTRPGSDNVGPRATPIGTAETHTVNSNDGQCAGDVPASATGLQLNVTSVDATIASFLTIWSDGARPQASSLNPTPGQPPVPNAVTTGITAGGDFNIYNNAGSVHVVVDIVGFYTDHDHDDRYYTEAEVDAALADKVTSPDRVSAHASEFDPITPGTSWAKNVFAQTHTASGSSECTVTTPEVSVGSTVSGMSIRYVAPNPATSVNSVLLVWKTEATVSTPLADIAVTVISDTRDVAQTAGSTIDVVTVEPTTPYVVQPGDRVAFGVCTDDDLTLWSGSVDLS